MYRVMVVDDERIERNGIRFLLKQMETEFDVREFPNGRAACEWLETETADILLTDIKMPLMDGLELIRRVSEMGRQMKIVIFSGFGEFEYARTAMRYNVEDYILKPVDPEEFARTMKRVVEELEAGRRAERSPEARAETGRGAAITALRNLESPQVSAGGRRQGHPEIQTVKDYICDHCEKELGIEMLAEMVCMAPAYLSALFKKETGQNLSRFIRAVRMETAKELLENTYRKIVDISAAVGYANVSYFCQSFREYFGVSPQRFRSKGESDEETVEEDK